MLDEADDVVNPTEVTRLVVAAVILALDSPAAAILDEVTDPVDPPVAVVAMVESLW